jgi:hypothetical protein
MNNEDLLKYIETTIQGRKEDFDNKKYESFFQNVLSKND